MFTDTETNDEDGKLLNNVTFPFPLDLNGVLTNREQYRLAALPIAIPLPAGHSLESVSLTDEPSLTAFLEQLQDVSQKHAEWAAAIILSMQLYNGKSLHLHEPTIHPAFTEGLTTNEFTDDIFVIASPVTSQSIEGRNLLQRTIAVRNINIDCWFEAHPDVCGQHAHCYALEANPNLVPPLAPNAPAPPVVYKSLKDRSVKHNIARARTITQLLLARMKTNANGDKIILPGTVSPTFEGGSSCPGLPEVHQSRRIHATTSSGTSVYQGSRRQVQSGSTTPS
jgi:ribosomal protein L31